MTQRNELYDIEKRVARTFGAGTSRPVPPFTDVEARLAAGEPRESFEEFFGGEASPVPVTALPSRGWKSRRWIALVAAAALLFVVGGGAAVGAIFGGAQMSAKSSADVADYEAFCENGDGKNCENAAAEDSEDSDRSVSDSDYHDTMSGDSSDVSP